MNKINKFSEFNFSEKKLSKIAYDVLYQKATETPYKNLYWNFWKPGIFVDPTNGEALFSSYDKYHSSCGWPAFYYPIDENAIKYLEDYSLSSFRIEIRTAKSNLHLGHVFDDLDYGVLAKKAKRFCINSAAIKFISEAEILLSNYQPWIKLWNTNKLKNKKNVKMITVAGGCFWGVEALIQSLSGIYQTTVGYANYDWKEPILYKEVCSGQTKATEAVQIFYNSELISLETILNTFFKHISPITLNYQGNDYGTQYRSGIYYSDLNDLTILKPYFLKLQQGYSQKIVCELLLLKNYFLAEDEHQNYLIKNPYGYCHIKI